MKHHIIIIFLLLLSFSANAQIRLYNDSLPEVTITPYLPVSQSAATPAIIVFPGGSYSWLAKQNEGHLVAQWFADHGIAAFVVTYRVVTPAKYFTGWRIVSGERLYPKMLNDARTAIKYVRQHATHYNINPRQIGTIGFSAGGHLSLFAGERFSSDSLICPDFVAAIYPVVTMSDSRHSHQRTRRAALGVWGQWNKEMRDSLSLEKHVPPTMPPTFLLCCKDDRTVDYQNTQMMDSALNVNHITHQTIIYDQGDHGFGGNTKKFSAETAQWQQTFLTWLNEILTMDIEH